MLIAKILNRNHTKSNLENLSTPYAARMESTLHTLIHTFHFETKLQYLGLN